MACFYVTFPLFVLALAVLPRCYSQQDSAGEFLVAESKLYKHLVDGINPSLRPVNQTKESVTVSLGVALIRIIEVNEVGGFIRLQTWLRYLWKDIRLRWDPSDFDNIDHIRIPADKIWQPDIVLYNSASPMKPDDVSNALTIVSSDGTVLWIPSAMLHVQCDFDMMHFPFDYQQCRLVFGSWTYDGWKVDPRFYDGMSKIDLSDYNNHLEWDVVEVGGQRYEKVYPCCEEPYPSLTFNVSLLRRSNYLRSMFYAPPVLVSLLLPFIFTLPAQHVGRYIVAVGGLVVMVVQLQALQSLFPTGHTSYLSYYYVAIFAYNFVCLWLAMMVSWVAGRAKSYSVAPAIVKWIIIDILGKVLCLPATTYVDFDSGEAKSGDSSETAPRAAQPGSGIAEWLTIARVLDRIFFVLSSIIIFILACALIPMPVKGPWFLE